MSMQFPIIKVTKTASAPSLNPNESTENLFMSSGFHLALNNMYPSGVNLNVSVNSLHYHVSGGSQYVMPIMFSTGSIATLHGHYGLFVNNPEDDSVVEGDSSFVLEWKSVANSNGTTTEYPETLLGPYPGFWYMD